MKRFIGPILFAKAMIAGQPASSPDAQFVIKAAQLNMASVPLSAWTKEHGITDEVKALAAEDLDNHTKLADELRNIAVNENAIITPDTDPKDLAEIDRIKTLEAANLDREYLHDIIRLHRKEADVFKREAESGKDPDLRSWASQKLPEIQAHLKAAEDLDRAMFPTTDITAEKDRAPQPR